MGSIVGRWSFVVGRASLVVREQQPRLRAVESLRLLPEAIQFDTHVLEVGQAIWFFFVGMLLFRVSNA